MAIAVGNRGGLRAGGAALNPALVRIKQLAGTRQAVPGAVQPPPPVAPTSAPAPRPGIGIIKGSGFAADGSGIQPRGGLSDRTPVRAPEFTPRAPVRPAPTPATSTFGPGNNLIGQQIQAPSSAANPYDQQAAQFAQGAGIGGYSGQTDEARQMILDQLKQLQSAPDRFQLAQEAFGTFERQGEPAYQQALRGVGQRAAALGRVGAGMTTNDLTGVLGQRQLQLGGERERLINQALQNTMQDRLGVSQALQAGGGLLGGQDLSMGQARSQAALGQAGLFQGLGQGQFGREAFGSQLQQQQQQYQSGLDQQNIQNQIAQQQLQQGAQGQAWQQQFAQQQLAAQLAAQQNTQYPSGGYGQPAISSAQLGYTG